MKPNPDIDENFWNIEDTIVPLEKKEGILKEFKKNIIKMEHHKIYQLLNVPTVSKKWEENEMKCMTYQIATILSSRI